MPDQRSHIPAMALCSVRPFSAFDLGWTYGPVTFSQHCSARRYAHSCKREVPTVPGFWIMPPASVNAPELANV